VIEQVGSPLELYRAPCNKFVAGFIGSPRMNFLTGPEADKHHAQTIGIRPEHITVSAAEGAWKGVIGVSEHLGSDTFFHVKVEGQTETLTVRAGGEVDLNYGQSVWLSPMVEHIHRFDAKGLRIA
jgi:multiple sugar transport system ATP-binding protein